MEYRIFATKEEMGAAAAADGIDAIRSALATRGEAFIIVATGASQFEVLGSLAAAPDIDWSRVTVFHLDEYVGLPITHPASFRGYLWQRFHSRLPLPVRGFHYLDGETDPEIEAAWASELISQVTIDVAFVGIGENGHLAFNDPPADFKTKTPYIIVDLDEACRRQQHGEGWFPSLEDVPRRAISMSVRQILKSKKIVCTVPDDRKATAVAAAIEGPVTPDLPASILQNHEATTIYLDKPAASLLSKDNG